MVETEFHDKASFALLYYITRHRLFYYYCALGLKADVPKLRLRTRENILCHAAESDTTPDPVVLILPSMPPNVINRESCDMLSESVRGRGGMFPVLCLPQEDRFEAAPCSVRPFHCSCTRRGYTAIDNTIIVVSVRTIMFLIIPPSS